MNSRIEQIVIGIIVLLVGVFIVMGGNLSFDLGGITLIAIGVGFMLMYRTKRKSWALVLGAYLAYLGVTASMGHVLPRISFSGRIGDFLGDNLLLITTGLVCMALFYDKNKRGLLIPGVIILGLCTNSFVRDVINIHYSWLTLLIYAGCFHIMYRLGNYFLGSWPKLVAIVFFILAVIRLVM